MITYLSLHCFFLYFLGGKLHWRVAEYDDFSSLSVEATAYAALTHLEMGGLEGSRPIINWLISQMNNEGSFVYVEVEFHTK